MNNTRQKYTDFYSIIKMMQHMIEILLTGSIHLIQGILQRKGGFWMKIGEYIFLIPFRRPFAYLVEAPQSHSIAK